MICRNEVHCIERCLNSCKWMVDCYRIVDTGSTDNTIEIIKRVMGDIPGEILVHPWTGHFANHRNQALPEIGFCGMGSEDYILMMDADDEMVIGMPFLKSALVDPCYSIANVDGEMSNYRPHLWKLGLGVKWILARHEVQDGLPTRSLLRPEQIKILIHHEGARSNNPNKGIEDAVAIFQDMQNYPKESSIYRYYTFLAACCCVDTQIFDKAMYYFKEFLRNADESDSIENIWMAHNLLATCAFMLHHPTNEVVEAYMSAINADPERLESYFLLARLLIDQNCMQSAKMIVGVTLKMQKKPYMLKHMAGWWDKRETFYNEICEAIKEETL